MDVTSYIKKSKTELKMPRTDPVTGVDNAGIRFEGPVLSGLVGVKHQLQQNAAGSPQTSAQIREIAPGGVTYIPPRKLRHLRPGPAPPTRPSLLRPGPTT